MADDTAPNFDAFWEASNYTQYNVKEFAAAQELYSAKDKVDSLLEYPAQPIKLRLAKTTVNRLAKKRSSQREFSAAPLSKRELGILLSSFSAQNGLEHRAYPSAGASYGLEVFCIANNVQGFSGKILYYNPDTNAVSVVGKAPSWAKQQDAVNVTVQGVPQCLILFTLFSQRLTAKYLERGGRFGLIEVGAAMQQLALQIANNKQLTGVAAGGLLDNFWLTTLNLDPQESKIALGYLCGR